MLLLYTLKNLVTETCTSFLHKNVAQVHASDFHKHKNIVASVVGCVLKFPVPETCMNRLASNFWYQILESVSPPLGVYSEYDMLAVC